MNDDLLLQIRRAEELIDKLEHIYRSCLGSKTISKEAKVITHEIFEKQSNILDQLTRSVWVKHLAPTLSDSEKERAAIYFPVAKDQHQFDSTIGRWRIADLKNKFPDVYHFFISYQPFTSDGNMWLDKVKDIAVQKHIGLMPQKREETTNITYSSPGGTVTFNTSAVKFGSGVSILGVPVDPVTQRIVPTEGISEKKETWVAFKIIGFDINVLPFSKESLAAVTNIVNEATRKFQLD